MTERERDEEKLTEEFLKKFEEELKQIEPDIPIDANSALIKELLGRLPAEIEYWSRKQLQIKHKANNAKVEEDKKKDLLNREKSRIRQERLKLHKVELDEYFKNIKEIFEQVIKSNNKATKSTLQEMVKAMRPEKPTKADLDDIANIETEDLQDEIYQLQEERTKLEIYADLLNAKVKRYDNKLKAVISHKGILVEEMKNGF